MSNTATTTEAILDLLNSYNGTDIWQDVIWTQTDIDGDATQAVDPDYASDRFITQSGQGFRFVGQSNTWVSWTDF